ncbi:tetraspanin-8-like [Durio zibethinus]|uniref:Tetraspanin-8-like n=1 Tax=Durio zibethinus TaxID=66656 RepID=A0A6P5YF56_DURZI|nr:tetraspanin-8-like [Durio zibethinus]
MGRVSNCIVVFPNSLLLLLGQLSLSFGVYFVVHGSTHCDKVLKDPLLIMGGFLVVVSLLGLIGSVCKNNFFMFIYLTVMFFLILGLIGLTVFLFLVTNHGAGKVFSERDLIIKERKSADFSNWLKNHFVNDKNWNQIKSCLIDAKVCTSVGNHNDHVNYKALVFFKNTLPALQSSCCKPPTRCGFRPKNATFWEVPKSGPATADPDCLTWSNNQWKLCYDCNSCKGGVLANFRKAWKSWAIINVILLIFLIFVYSVGCCARRSNQKSNRKYIRGFA